MIVIEWMQALISYQDYHMILLVQILNGALKDAKLRRSTMLSNAAKDLATLAKQGAQDMPGPVLQERIERYARAGAAPL